MPKSGGDHCCACGIVLFQTRVAECTKSAFQPRGFKGFRRKLDFNLIDGNGVRARQITSPVDESTRWNTMTVSGQHKPAGRHEIRFAGQDNLSQQRLTALATNVAEICAHGHQFNRANTRFFYRRRASPGGRREEPTLSMVATRRGGPSRKYQLD